MKDYLASNAKYWSKGFNAPNVDQAIFRFYGRILKPEFNLSGKEHEAILDFGCGQGAAVNFFHLHGFETFGVDSSLVDIDVAKARYSYLQSHFKVIDPDPLEGDVFFDRQFHVVVAVHSLYYLSATDLEIRLRSLYNMLGPGGIIYASMIGTQETDYYFNSEEAYDGLRKVCLKTGRLDIDGCYMNFTSDEDELRRKFHMFRPRHVGFISERYRSDEAPGFHFLFVGVKE
jgi:2-polyprenyl-3-methyl-5-hydroxy-6-metoxy-1,4-benzoquinol methylase